VEACLGKAAITGDLEASGRRSARLHPGREIIGADADPRSRCKSDPAAHGALVIVGLEMKQLAAISLELEHALGRPGTRPSDQYSDRSRKELERILARC